MYKFNLNENILVKYDTKHFFCLFEKPFKIQENGVFLKYLFFRFRDIDVYLLCKLDL